MALGPEYYWSKLGGCWPAPELIRTHEIESADVPPLAAARAIPAPLGPGLPPSPPLAAEFWVRRQGEGEQRLFTQF